MEVGKWNDTWNDKLATQWQDAVNLVLGLWLAVSPWILSYASEATPARTRTSSA